MCANIFCSALNLLASGASKRRRPDADAEYNSPMKHVITFALVLCLAAIAMAIPPLTPSQEAQVQTANDKLAQSDEPALYPLMENALSWQNGDESGAMVPDYAAIAKTPADSRGKLFLIEGQYVGRSRLDGDKLAARTRPGPWSGKLQEWVLFTSRERDEVVVVYVVDPPVPLEKMPRPGTPIRLVARFFKVLPDTDKDGKPTEFLTFVAKSATIVQGETGGAGLSSGTLQAIGVIALLGVVYMIFRVRKAIKASRNGEFSLRKDETLEQRERRLSRLREEEEGAAPLPKDPVEALAELERRRVEKEKLEGESKG